MSKPTPAEQAAIDAEDARITRASKADVSDEEKILRAITDGMDE